MEETILEIDGLNLYFTQYERGLRRRILRPVCDLSCPACGGENDGGSGSQRLREKPAGAGDRGDSAVQTAGWRGRSVTSAGRWINGRARLCERGRSRWCRRAYPVWIR